MQLFGTLRVDRLRIPILGRRLDKVEGDVN